MVATGAQLEFRDTDGLQESSPPIPIWKPSIFSHVPSFRVQQMAMAGFHQLLLAVATDIELEVAAPLVWAIIQFARPAAQTVFAREDVRGIHV
ncbi:Uncharacterised protein [Escherichia coli]|uniref:Uncharacterized protein n=1 Tax=Escherichia coli TaxID=562 RepID=A0A376KZH6_ECOLX|nr:Uncharacterised protein [Escherichia coli]